MFFVKLRLQLPPELRRSLVLLESTVLFSSISSTDKQQGQNVRLLEEKEP
jgi:hypothetical protein